jgi:O-antigen ligase
MISNPIFRLQLGLAAYAVLSLISMATMSIGAAIFVALWLSVRPWRDYAFDSRLRPYVWLSVAFWGVAIVGLIYARVNPLSYGGESFELSWPNDVAKAWYFCMPFCLADGFRRLDLQQRESVLRAWFFAFLVLSVIGIQQYWTAWPREQRIPTHLEHFHATMFLGHHLSTASIWIFPVFAALGWTLQNPKESRWISLAAALGIATLILSFARSVWLALPVGLFLMMVLQLRGRLRLGVLVGATVLAVAISQHPAVQKRITNNMGTQERIALWEANFEFLKQRPALGVGLFKNAPLSGAYLKQKQQRDHVFSGHAHNNLIHMLGGVGILGTLLWLGICVWIGSVFWGARADARFGVIALGFFCAWIVFHLNGLTQVNFWEGKVMHQYIFALGMALGITYRHGNSTSRTH